MKKQIHSIAPGILLCIAIALPAWYLGRLFPIIGGPVFGIIFGMMIAMLFPQLLSTMIQHSNTVPDPNQYLLDAGVKYTSKKLLQYSIILLGFEMNLFNVIKVGRQSLFVIFFTLLAAFFMAYFMGQTLKVQGKMATLIGVGTSICGGSAIAATAPIIKAEAEDVAHAISTIFLFNIIAVFIFPPLGHLLGLSDTGFGMWAGTAINDTSSVVAAGASWSAMAGNNAALAYATIVKLTRTLMIVPITLVLAIYSASGRNSEIGNNFRFSKVFPWFVLGFVGAALINTFAGIPLQISQWLVTVGKFVIVMAMAAIGLNTNLKKLITNGFKPIFLGLCCWFAVATTSLLVQFIIRMW